MDRPEQAERFTNCNAERLGDDIYIWYDAENGDIAPYILDEDHARDLVAKVTAALSPPSTKE